VVSTMSQLAKKHAGRVRSQAGLVSTIAVSGLRI
jgi:hypothetical protein